MKSLTLNKALLMATLIFAGTCSSCKRSELLDEKPSSLLVVPSTLQDFQALLDLATDMNVTPSIAETSADNYYLTLADYNSLGVSEAERKAYVWKPVLFEPSITVPSWNYPYKQVFVANVVLEGLGKMAVNSTNEESIKTMKGAALFYRAYAFYNIAQVFAPMYDTATAATTLGIPLRLSSDISEKSVRSSLKETYDQILADLNEAITLLPPTLPASNLNRPSRIAALALLARLYLSVRAYASAETAANDALQLYSTLLDYNTVAAATGNFPFPRTNVEVIYQSNFENSTRIVAAVTGVGNVDSTIYQSYAAGDLRKVLYYRLVNSVPRFRGSYSQSIFMFSGLATDELYLIRAECRARAGNYIDAMNDLNTLLEKRFTNTVSYVPLTASNAQEALDIILSERRKELPARGLRWSDLRRLNKEGYNIIPRRVLDGQEYTLPPGSPLYAIPIPADVITLTGMEQNPR